jgi:hypothetical protein
MNGFIKNNKEILIAFFCVWIGIVFTLIAIKLSNIDKGLSSIDDIASEIDSSNLGDTGFYLKDISSELSAISEQLKTDAFSRAFGR